MQTLKVIVTSVLLCVYSSCIAQSVATDVYLHPLEVKNKIVMDVLNALDNEVGECIFAKYCFPYCYGIFLTSAYPHKVNVTFHTIQNYVNPRFKGYGYFYYKDKLVLVEKTNVAECDLYEKWFERKAKIDTLHLVRPTTKVFYYPGSCNGIEQVSYTYQYDNDSLVLIEDWHCSQIEKYYHYISYVDSSWQKIANLYQLPLDSLKNKNKQSLFKKPPQKGKSVRIY